MCKCCNLFSPSQAELLSHVSEKHAEEGVNVDEIIIPLRPLSTPEPTNPGRTGDGKGAGVSGGGATPTGVPLGDDAAGLPSGNTVTLSFCLVGTEIQKLQVSNQKAR